MAVLFRTGVFALTVLIPGGLLLLPAYFALRSRKRSHQLDFDGVHRRVPRTRQTVPLAPRQQRGLKILRRAPRASLQGSGAR